MPCSDLSYPVSYIRCAVHHYSVAGELRYVIMAQMRALDTPDPFNDDFYYHNAMRRKQEKTRREALVGQDPNARVGGRRLCV